MKKFNDLINDCAKEIIEIFPWDLEDILKERRPLLLDIREPYEYESMHIDGSINVPRGVLETACEFDYEETVPELASGRDKEIIVICRSGKRSVLGAYVMKQMGFRNAVSLTTGLRGWSEYEQPLVTSNGETVDEDTADDYFAPRLRPEQLSRK